MEAAGAAVVGLAAEAADPAAEGLADRGNDTQKTSSNYRPRKDQAGD